MINSKEKESNSSNNNNNQSKPKTYKMIKLIGEGAFGKAYLVECIADRVINLIYFHLYIIIIFRDSALSRQLTLII